VGARLTASKVFPEPVAIQGLTMQFIDKIPFSFLLIITVFMLGAPFVPEPHLVEKMRMLVDGTLTKPLDIFDVFWHLLPATLLAVKLVRKYRHKLPN
jgi:hypothetical protein